MKKTISPLKVKFNYNKTLMTANIFKKFFDNLLEFPLETEIDRCTNNFSWNFDQLLFVRLKMSQGMYGCLWYFQWNHDVIAQHLTVTFMRISRSDDQSIMISEMLTSVSTFILIEMIPEPNKSGLFLESYPGLLWLLVRSAIDSASGSSLKFQN